MTLTRSIALAAGVGTLFLGGLSLAGEGSIERLRGELAELRAQNEALEARIDAREEARLDETRANEIRGIVQDVLADTRTRTSLQDAGSMAGYTAGKGFRLASQDGAFSLRISGQIQTRWVFNHVGDDTNEAGNVNEGSNKNMWGFQIRRAKVKFKGNVIDKNWRYQINGAFGSDGTFDFEEVMLTHDVNENLSVTVGQYKAPFTREELVSSSRQLAVERSLVNEYFNADRGLGLDLKYTTDQWSLEAAYNNGVRTAYTGGNRYTSSVNNNTKWAVQGRFQYKLSGSWGDFKSFNSSPDDEEAVMIGVAGMAQQWNGNPNVFGTPAVRFQADHSNVWGVTADISAKFAGFSLFGAVVYQRFEGPTQTAPGAAVETGSVNPWGFVGQAGYSLNDQWEVFGRFSWANNRGLEGISGSGIDTASADAKLSLLTVGVNYFINDNVKFTADWGINLNNSLSGDWVSQRSNGWRATESSGEWVLRAQLQLLF